MKHLFIILILISSKAGAQFHEKVEPVTSFYDYNTQRAVVTTVFIISFTNDNWKTKNYILTYDPLMQYSGKPNIDWEMQIGWKSKDGYIPLTFKNKLQAIQQAQKLNTYAKCKAYNEELIRKQKKREKETDNSPVDIY